MVVVWGSSRVGLRVHLLCRVGWCTVSVGWFRIYISTLGLKKYSGLAYVRFVQAWSSIDLGGWIFRIGLASILG